MGGINKSSLSPPPPLHRRDTSVHLSQQFCRVFGATFGRARTLAKDLDHLSVLGAVIAYHAHFLHSEQYKKLNLVFASINIVDINI